MPLTSSNFEQEHIAPRSTRVKQCAIRQGAMVMRIKCVSRLWRRGSHALPLHLFEGSAILIGSHVNHRAKRQVVG